jgi:hypothetical protein
MSRLSKAPYLVLALAALGIFTSCSSSTAHVRIVNAISDAQASLDVDVNGTKITGSTPIPFQGIFPSAGSAATYASVSSGTDTIAAFLTNTTGSPVSQCTSCSLSSSTEYTVILDGLAANGSTNQVAILTDNNTAPTTGSLEFRVIDGSYYTPSGGFDVYLTPPSGDITGITPQTITLGEATSYVTLANASYNVVVTPHGNPTADVNFNLAEADGSIRTVVIVDNSGGGSGPASIPLVFTDLN